jgi:hypothetical protein
MDRPLPPHIGTLNEGSLHAALKALNAEPGDELEVPLEGFVVDIRRDDLLVEIQTASFGSLGRKLDRLLGAYRVLLVHPIAVETYLSRPGREPRKSAQRGSIFDIFDELVSLPTLIDHPQLTLDVVLASVTKVQRESPRARRGRSGYRTVDRRLREVVAIRRFAGPDDLAALLPADLPSRFTTADLAAHTGVPRDTAQRMAFCLRALEVITEAGRDSAGIHYELAEARPEL